jgi:hypothetical protein
MMTDAQWKRARANEKEDSKKKVFIALDPGISTGMAVLDWDGELRASTTWGTEELATSLDALIRGLHLTDYVVEVVIEAKPPGSYGHLGAKLDEVRRRIDYIVRETYELPVTVLKPSEWKPSDAAKSAVVKGWRFAGTPMTTHQKDAFRMGRYAVERRRATLEELRLRGWVKGRQEYERG